MMRSPAHELAAVATATLRVFASALLVLASPLAAQEEQPSPVQFQMHRGIDPQEVIERTLRRYSGDHAPGVDTSTLTGKVMCGYQGWFSCPDDGSGRGWHHWQEGRRFEPGACTIDIWPDVSELDDDERFKTSFVNKDDSPAEVFSSLNAKTVNRHFQWMREYGIDGVFVRHA